METNAIIDSSLLEKLERLSIHWQKSLPGLVGGHNLSRIRGSGQEFLDHRHFHHGDDLRDVNWRAYLRLEKLFLKMFQLEPRIPVRILLDVSHINPRGFWDVLAQSRTPVVASHSGVKAFSQHVRNLEYDTFTPQPDSEAPLWHTTSFQGAAPSARACQKKGGEHLQLVATLLP